MGRAYLARRESAEGASPVVIKVVHPNFGDGQVSAELVAQKEAVALGRLNERVPPCPFVVRFIDTGSAVIFTSVPTPWLAIEYVHGGVEGTTLEDRVTYSIQRRAMRSTLSVPHMLCAASHQACRRFHGGRRNSQRFNPGNVLCVASGRRRFQDLRFRFGATGGLGRTFAGLGLGTVGYAAPEQSVDGETPAGPRTDVFAPRASSITADGVHTSRVSRRSSPTRRCARRSGRAARCGGAQPRAARTSGSVPRHRRDPRAGDELPRRGAPRDSGGAGCGDHALARRVAVGTAFQPAPDRDARRTASSFRSHRLELDRAASSAGRPRDSERCVGHGRSLFCVHAAGTAVLERPFLDGRDQHTRRAAARHDLRSPL